MVAQANDDWTLTAPQALVHYAPVANAALDELIAATAMVEGNARLPLLVRKLCAQTLGLTPLHGVDVQSVDVADWRHAPAFSDGERAVLALAEQFCIDVSAIAEAQRSAFLQVAGSGAFALATAIYVADFTPRLRRVLERLFGPAASWPAVASARASADAAFQEFIRVVYNMRGLDPVITELVRLRGARQHQCRLCKALRARSALAAGADEAAFDAIDRYTTSDFSAQQKAALALADAMIWEPAHIAETVIADIRTHFTPAQAVELVLDIMRNAANKSAVALAADAPISDDVQVYEIDEAGNMHVGLAMPALSV